MLTPHICPHLRDITQLTPYINTLMSLGKTYSDWMEYRQNCILTISMSQNAFPLLCSSRLRHVHLTAIAIFQKTQQIWIELSCQTVCKQIFSQYSECIFFFLLPFAVTYRVQILSSPITSYKNDPSGAFIVHEVKCTEWVWWLWRRVWSGGLLAGEWGFFDASV